MVSGSADAKRVVPDGYCPYCKLPRQAIALGERLAILYPWHVERHGECEHVFAYRSQGVDRVIDTSDNIGYN